MNDSNMTGTGFPNAVPQASSNRETGKKTTRSAIPVSGNGRLRTAVLFPTLLPIQTKGKDRTNPMADRPDSGILLFPNPATVRHLSAFSMANARDMWHEAPALSFEICRGITAFGQYYPDPRATVRQTVGLAARRLAPSLLQIPFHDYFSDISYDTRRRYFQTAIRAREALYKA